MKKFRLQTSFEPCGDQPQAIKKLVDATNRGKKSQVLLGITGSGKTFTMANVISQVQRPALIIAHNKTLASQLYHEFKTFFPDNAVEYFVSYYDYYQPEAYLPRSDTYIEKDMSINEEIDKMRLSATRSLIEREDVIIVASVSCIYGLGMPEYYAKMNLLIESGESYRRDELLVHLLQMHYTRNDFDFSRKNFRVRGDVLEIFPAYEDDLAIRVEFFDDEVERISEIDPLTGKVLRRLDRVTIYPGSHHVTPESVRLLAMETIKEELNARVNVYENDNRITEKERIWQRTMYDLEMIREVGFCKGIENYSRHFGSRSPGSAPSCLIDYFPKNFLLFVDESHQTLPQIHAMYNGDHARKQALVDYGFRLPSAFDNRPLKFDEVFDRIGQVIYVSATPGKWEVEEAGGEVVDQIIRPTGLLDPQIEVRPASGEVGQVDDCLEEIKLHTEKGGRVLVTTLTKRLAEELSKYLQELNIKSKYLHSDVDTLERVQIIRDLRSGVCDVLVGINLLREGLDIPEVSLVAILDADKEGFLRSQTALIQTCGRASRNSEGRVIMYADRQTESIRATLEITASRRAVQQAYNEKHGITPTTTKRELGPDLTQDVAAHTLSFNKGSKTKTKKAELPSPEKQHHYLTGAEINGKIKECEADMKLAAKEHRFEDAALLRDAMHHFQEMALTLL